MNGPRLLIASTIPETIEAFLLPYARHFRAQGWRVDALARRASGNAACVAAFDRVWDAGWTRNPIYPRNLPAAGFVRDLVARERYDLVHVHTPVASFVTRYALRGRQAGPAVVYTAHGFHFHPGGHPVTNGAYRLLEQVAGRWTDYLVVINREDERAAYRHAIVPPARVRYIPGIGVDLSVYDPGAVAGSDVRRVRAGLGLAPAAAVFLMIAEFIPRKNHRDALLALASLGDPRAHLVLAGDGPLAPEMRRLAHRLGIGDRVRFVGYRNDIPALLATAVATLLPSRQEGLPRSALESLCFGVPVIATRIRGVEELLTNGGGLAVPVGDVAGLARAMAWVLADPAAARALGERGRARVGAYDLRRVLRLHETLYEQALRRTPVGRADTRRVVDA